MNSTEVQIFHEFFEKLNSMEIMESIFPMKFRFPLADEFTLQHGGFSAWLCQALLWSHNGYRVRRTVIAASPDMKFFSWTDATEDLGRLWIFPWKPRVLPGIIAKSLRNA